MIQDLFIYFARFPKKEGVKSMFTMGDSSYSEYTQLLTALDEMTDCEWVPEIENYVYGQSIEDLQQRINKLFGSWMMVDYGEITTKADRSGSLQVGQQIAITVAMKMRQNSDMAERVIASDRTLKMTSGVLSCLWNDVRNGRVNWFGPGELQEAEIVPFVASELSSYGWTLMLQISAPDTLNIKTDIRNDNGESDT